MQEPAALCGKEGEATPSPPDLSARERAAVADFLAQLARAVHRYRTYPPASPLCREALVAAHGAFRRLRRRERLTLDVGPEGIALDGRRLEVSPSVETELVRRFLDADVLEVALDAEAALRDLEHFCRELAMGEIRAPGRESLGEGLAHRGVERIRVVEVPRIEVVEAGPVPAARLELLHAQRRIAEGAAGEGAGRERQRAWLFRPGTAWLRLDLSIDDPGELGLTDLALLYADPGELAVALSRLAAGPDEAGAAAEPALAEWYGPVARIYGALEPRLAEAMLERLAHSVLEMAAGPRRELLRRTILPGLLDGSVDGAVVRHFPDVDIADALVLLLDLQTAVPEVLTAGLERLGLSPEREASLVPLLEARLTRRDEEDPASPGEDAAPGLARLRVEGDAPLELGEFAAFDLAVDGAVARRLEAVAAAVAERDGGDEMHDCALRLLRIEPNPDRCEPVLARLAGGLAELAEAGAWERLAAVAGSLAVVGRELRAERPEVARRVEASLAEACGPELLQRLADAEAAPAAAVLRAFGPAAGAAVLEALQAESDRSSRRELMLFLCRAADAAAPHLRTPSPDLPWFVVRNVARILGHAGGGYEQPLAELLEHPHEQVRLEALRALARVGTWRAGAAVADAIARPASDLREEAELALRRFPGGIADRLTARLLARSDFIRRDPALALRLLEARPPEPGRELTRVLRRLRRLRWRWWRPALARLGRAAARRSEAS